jgi:hypothetical protein
MKTCQRCETAQPVDCFYKTSKKSTRRRNVCKKCVSMQYTATPTTPEQKEQKQANHRLRKYGVTREDYASMMDSQGGVCAICAEGCDLHGHLCVDHDHATGEVRGLLCHRCNAGLGYFKDDQALMRAAIGYVSGATLGSFS